MYALCLESSHERGMGHLFRGMNLYKFLCAKNEQAVIFINQNKQAVDMLKQRRIPYEEICFEDTESDWESKLIKKYGIDVWLNDKYETTRVLYENVKKNKGVILAAVDEKGGNDDLLDIHFLSMTFQKDFVPKGKYVFRGVEYLSLNEEIEKYRHLRVKAEHIVVSMGGSDTYGATIKVLNVLKKKRIPADIVVGFSFEHMEQLMESITEEYRVFQGVPSLIQKFSEYDVAITGGGVTCLEAAAAGLPCIIIANELFEVDTAKYVENMGAAVFAGLYTQIDEEKFDFEKLNVTEMSRAGMQNLTLDGSKNIYDKIQVCRKML